MNKDFLLFLKGFFMGIANIIPGVSGGTIALITNIYEDLIFSLKSLNTKRLLLLFFSVIIEAILSFFSLLFNFLIL